MKRHTVVALFFALVLSFAAVVAVATTEATTYFAWQGRLLAATQMTDADPQPKGTLSATVTLAERTITERVVYLTLAPLDSALDTQILRDNAAGFALMDTDGTLYPVAALRLQGVVMTADFKFDLSPLQAQFDLLFAVPIHVDFATLTLTSSTGNGGSPIAVALDLVPVDTPLDISGIDIAALSLPEIAPPVFVVPPQPTPNPTALSAQQQQDFEEALQFFAQKRLSEAHAVFTRLSEAGMENAQAEADKCILPWPKSGIAFRDERYISSATTFNFDVGLPDAFALYIKIYHHESDKLVATLFVPGTGRVRVNLPVGTYRFHIGSGKHWFGLKDAFGSSAEAFYEQLTFEDQDTLLLSRGQEYTLTLNVERNPEGGAVGSNQMSWREF